MTEAAYEIEIIAPEPLEPIGGGEWAPVLRVDLDEDGHASIIVTSSHSSERNSMPMSVWNGRAQRWSNVLSQGSIGVVDATALHVLRDEIAPLMAIVAAGHETYWDGSNYRGRLNGDAADVASEMIGRLVEECQFLRDDVGVWHARDWIQPGLSDVIQEYGLTGKTSEDQIRDIASKLEAEALHDNVILQDTEEALQEIIDDMKAEEEEEEEDASGSE